MSQEQTDNENAETLFIEGSTTKTFVNNILSKPGVSSRVEAVVSVLQGGRADQGSAPKVARHVVK